MHWVYFDNSSTTQVDPEVVDAMLPYFTERYGNASSIHELGYDAYRALEDARTKVAKLISADPESIYFTGGGTEADNIAVEGVAFKNRGRRGHIVTTTIEHPAVLNTCRHLESLGFDVTYLPVDRHGLVEPHCVADAIRTDTILISVMTANNEIGTVEPIEEIGRIASETNIPFHTDAIQACGKVKLDVDEQHIDLMAISAHKFHGPKGVGAVFIRDRSLIEPILFGGGQEHSVRPSTENIPGIVGLGKAAELAAGRFDVDRAHTKELRDLLIRDVLNGISDVQLNGHPVQRLPINAHFSYIGTEGRDLVLDLSEHGVASSTGSACHARVEEPSHVLVAIGLSDIEVHGSIRLTLSKFNTKEEVEYVVDVLRERVPKLREVAPYRPHRKVEVAPKMTQEP